MTDTLPHDGMPAAGRIATTEEIRGHFPAVQRRHNGFAVAYFDGPGGTQVPRAVAEAMVDYLYHHNANTHWNFPTSVETDAALAHARWVLATYLGCSPDEVVFGANMTTLTLHLSRALARRLEPGDEIIVTELDHHANIDPWMALEHERGVLVRQARLIPETGKLDWEHLESLFGPRTRLVAIGAAANALGTVNDVERAVTLAHVANALSFVDGVHFAPHVLPDVASLGCDFFACSPYKVYGPHLGVLFGRNDLLDDLDFARLRPAGQHSPERAETGTLSHEAIVGAAAAVEWLASLTQRGDLRERLEAVYPELHVRGQELFASLWEGLAEIPGVRLFGPPADDTRTPTAAFTVDGVPSSQVSERLGARGVFTSHGDFYAQTVVERLGLQPEGLVRAGCACYTTSDEVERLVDGVRTVTSER